MKIIFFYIKDFEIGYPILIFSSIRISTYQCRKTNKLYLLYNYHRLYALVLFFLNVFHRHKKSFLFIKIEVHRCIT